MVRVRSVKLRVVTGHLHATQEQPTGVDDAAQVRFAVGDALGVALHLGNK